jgi:hypothetical protein
MCGFLLTPAWTAGAQAGTYHVVACDDAPNTANHSWSATNTAPSKLEMSDACFRSDIDGGLYARDVLDVSNAAPQSYAEWTFTAPPGTAIASVAYSRWLYKEDDDDWQPALRANGAIVDSCSIVYPAIECNAGGQGGQRTTATTPSTTGSLAFGVTCNAPTGSTCVNGAAGLHDAIAVLYGATVTLTDTTAPSVSNLGGNLLAGGYVTGSRLASFDASDNVGIRTGRLYVDGSVRASSTYDCDFTYAIPCSNKSGAQLSIDTSTLSDGTHTVRVAAVDPAANETKSASQTVLVDNGPPAAPSNLAIEGGNDWRSSNSFSVTWTNPTDAGSPIAAARYRLCAPDGSTCQAPQRVAASNIARLDGIAVPSQGEWLLRVWLEDAAGNVDSTRLSSTTLRFGAPPAAPTQNNSPVATAPTSSTEPSTQTAGPLVDVTTTLTTPPSSPEPPALSIRRDLQLRLTSARLSHGRLLVRGRVASGATPRLIFTVRARSGRLARRTMTIKSRRFTVSLKVRDPRGRLTARFAGDPTFLPTRATIRPRR